MAFAITGADLPITLTYDGGKTAEIPIDRSNLAGILRVTLIWSAPVDLALHVIEPGGALGGEGDAAASRSPEQYGLIGSFDIDARGPAGGQQSYILLSGQDKSAGFFTAYVENATRGRRPQGDHCGQGRYARIAAALIVTDRGKINKTEFELPALPCQQPIDDSEYYVKLSF